MDWDLYFLINPDRAGAAVGLARCCHGMMDPAQLFPTTQSGPQPATHHPPLRHPRQHPMLRWPLGAGGAGGSFPGSLCWVTLPGLGAVMALSPQQLSAQPHITAVTYVRFCSNIWPNISPHSRCN